MVGLVRLTQPRMGGWIDAFNTRAVQQWNEGDLEGFCESYAKTAIMVTRDGVFEGRKSILAAYRITYPNKDTMGQISVERINSVSPSCVLFNEDLALGVAIMRCTIVREGQAPEIGYSMVSFAFNSSGQGTIFQDTST